MPPSRHAASRHASQAEQEKKSLAQRKPKAPASAGRQPAVSSADIQAALARPEQARPEVVLRLQRMAGNRAVTGLVQRKLVVGAAHDPYEQEADRVAEQVMRQPPAPVQRSAEAQGTAGAQGTAEAQAQPLADSISRLVQRAAEEEEEVQTLPLQREAAPEEEEEIQTLPLQREAAPEEEEEIQAKPLQREAAPEEEELQTKPAAGATFAPGQDFEDQLNAQRGSGQPLPAETRQFMEGRFGVDFSGVRLHTGSEPARLNRAVSAQAFTQGRDIYLGEGKYNPGSAEGQQLLAHELTHVVQQTGSAARVQRDHKDTGLKKEAALTRFSQKVKARVAGERNFLGLGKKKEWANLTAQARADKVLKYVNAELKNTHVPEMKSVNLQDVPPFGDATFDFQTWSIDLHSPGLDGELTEDQVSKLGDSMYHESRHGEQWFRMARLKAGEGLDADQIKTKMYIPLEIAQAAVDRPLKPLSKVTRMLRSKQFVERQDAKLQEAKDWYTSIYGSNATNRNQVLGDIQNRYADYRALSEEVDAWNVGTAANKKIKELLTNA